MSLTTRRTALFGPYALDLRSGELRKFGTKVKMGEQAFQILLMLLETPGEMVTREQLRTKLWAHDTFVDFDHGLNSAVQRLRDSLSDSAGKPRWVETIPRRGYRFIGQVEWSDDSLASELLPIPTVVVPEGSIDDKADPSVNAASSTLPGKTWIFSRRVVPFAVAFLVVLLVAAVLIVKRIHAASLVKQPSEIRSLAVLPLENLSGDPAQEYFADGMTDEVITMLAKNPALRVTSRTSVMQYKKVHRPLREIAKELGVEGILEGSVGRSGNRVHVTAQLIRADSDTHLWADSFDRDLSDVALLQTQLAEAIAKQVGVTTSSEKPVRKIKPEAHDEYLLGRYYWFAEAYEQSRGHFQKAIDLQPDYSNAWSGLANYYAASAVVGDHVPGDYMPRAEQAASKALELDDLDSDAHRAAAAVLLFYRWDWAAADRESARSVELNPTMAEAHHFRAYVLSALNRLDEAVAEDKKAVELEPFVRPWELGFALIRARKFDAAVTELRMRSEAQPNDGQVHSLLSIAYFAQGREQEGENEAERALTAFGNKQAAVERQERFRHGGYRAIVESNLKGLLKQTPKEYISPLEFAELFAKLKRKEETLHYLQLSYQERSPFLVMVQCEWKFDFLHSDPRYQALVNKMGLPPAY